MKNRYWRGVRPSTTGRLAVADFGNAFRFISSTSWVVLLALTWGVLAIMQAEAAPAVSSPIPAPRPARLVVNASPAIVPAAAAEIISDSYGVFGSVAIAFAALPAANRWREILAEEGDKYFSQGCNSAGLCGYAAMKNLQQIARDAAGLPRQAMLALVNRRVNRAFVYTSDEAAFGQLDYWAGLGETVRRGAADCEDFAIAKMWILKSLGFKLDDLQFVVLKDIRRGRYHAVLAAHLGGKALILDNVTDAVFSDKAARYYKPIYSLSQSGSWIHGFRSGQRALAASGGGFAAVHPGAR